MQAASKLVQPQDASYPLLQKVLKAVPGAKDDLAKGYLTDLFEPAERGKLADDANLVIRRRSRLGPRTKAALFDPQQLKDIDASLELARRIAQNPNPPESGTMVAVAKALTMLAHPVAATAALIGGRALAEVLYNPAGASALKATLQGTATPIQTTLLKSLIAKASSSAADQTPPPSAPQIGQ